MSFCLSLCVTQMTSSRSWGNSFLWLQGQLQQELSLLFPLLLSPLCAAGNHIFLYVSLVIHAETAAKLVTSHYFSLTNFNKLIKRKINAASFLAPNFFSSKAKIAKNPGYFCLFNDMWHVANIGIGHNNMNTMLSHTVALPAPHLLVIIVTLWWVTWF